MKAQTEAMSMTIFLLIAVVLLFSVFVWGNSVIGGNADEAGLLSSERFVRSLDEKIRSVAKNGGSEILAISPSANIRTAENNSIEYAFQNNAIVPDYWIYLVGDEAAESSAEGYVQVIREKKEGGIIRMQLYYRNTTGTVKFLIQPFIQYEGGGKNTIKIEGNGTSISGGLAVNRVRISVG